MASAEAATAAAGDAEQQISQDEEGQLDSARSDVPEDCISPNSDVFSYFMMTSPNELIKHHRFTVDAMMSYLSCDWLTGMGYCCLMTQWGNSNHNANITHTFMAFL